MLATAAGISDEQAREPSSLPGWSRGHVLTHLARNADGLRNLLIWARTGVVTPQYPSFEVRNEEIEAGAGRPARELVVDFADSATAFEAETARLRDGDWAAEVRGVRGAAHPAWYTLWRRLSELEIHHVDLDAATGPRTGRLISPVSACRGQPPASPAPTPPRRCCARQTTVASTASGRQARNQPSRSPASPMRCSRGCWVAATAAA